MIDEAALDRFFNPNDKYVTAKIFFEGNGLVLESKMKHPKMRWKGVPIILTSNVLPSGMHPQGKKPKEEEEYKYNNRVNNHNAFKSRTCLIEMMHRHENSEEFPYTAEELGIYMKDYIDS